MKLRDLSTGKAIKTIGSDPAGSIGVSSDGSAVLTCVESEWAFRWGQISYLVSRVLSIYDNGMS